MFSKLGNIKLIFKELVNLKITLFRNFHLKKCFPLYLFTAERVLLRDKKKFKSGEGTSILEFKKFT